MSYQSRLHHIHSHYGVDLNEGIAGVAILVPILVLELRCNDCISNTETAPQIRQRGAEQIFMLSNWQSFSFVEIAAQRL